MNELTLKMTRGKVVAAARDQKEARSQGSARPCWGQKALRKQRAKPCHPLSGAWEHQPRSRARRATFQTRTVPTTQGLLGQGVVPREKQGSSMDHQTSWWPWF